VQAAVEPPGAFRCQLCGVTISGQRNLDEHLASKRHAKHVAAAAAAAAASAAGPDATHGLALAAAVAGLPGAGSSSALSPPGGGRTYVGIGADVAPYVCQVGGCALPSSTPPLAPLPPAPHVLPLAQLSQPSQLSPACSP
jgi:hypothetical protein